MRTGAARAWVGNFHEGGFYVDDGEFLALIVPFVTGGVAAGEPVVIGYDERKCDLIRRALPRTDGVTFIGDARLYASPARALKAWRREFDRHLSAGAGQIRITGEVPHEGNGGRFAGWDRYESAVNTVWQDHPVWSRCLYDATSVPDDVRDVVERTHRRLVTPDGGAADSPRYQDVDAFESLPPEFDPLQSTAPALELTGASLKETRRRVADVAAGRIGPAALDDLLFALAEVVVNAELHGRPPTTVRVWTATDRMVVCVHDTGAGPAHPLTGLIPAPEGSAGPGLGLWLCHQLADLDIALIPHADGFTVRLRAGRLPGPADRTVDAVVPGAGTSSGAPPRTGTVHAVDGDGTSFCDLVDADRLLRIDGWAWVDVRRDLRCPKCELVLAPHGLG
ncbi:anti-sigma factor RsbA family regulatory protein [Geodermatophilus sp. URMC 64]